MVFSRIGRAESQMTSNLGTRRWHAGLGYNLLNNIKNILLLCGKLRHVEISRYCMRIQFSLFLDRFKRVQLRLSERASSQRSTAPTIASAASSNSRSPCSASSAI